MDIADAPQKWVDEQCGHAAAMIAEGCTEDQLRRLCRFVRSQKWRTTLVSLKTIRGLYGDWVMDGEPEQELPPAERENVERNWTNGQPEHLVKKYEHLFDTPRQKPERAAS